MPSLDVFCHAVLVVRGEFVPMQAPLSEAEMITPFVRRARAEGADFLLRPRRWRNDKPTLVCCYDLRETMGYKIEPTVELPSMEAAEMWAMHKQVFDA